MTYVVFTTVFPESNSAGNIAYKVFPRSILTVPTTIREGVVFGEKAPKNEQREER